MHHGLGDMCRFHRIEVHRLALVHGAESAVSRACVAAEHECRGLIGPAFEDVRAFRFLADGVQVQSADEVEDCILIARIAELDLQPIRLLQTLAALTVQKLLN